jgi:hypothetical protein
MHQLVPNSHSWGSLEGILYSFEYNPEIMTNEYLIIGLENTIKRKYEIEKFVLKDYPQLPVFYSIENMIEFINSNSYRQENFITIIKNNLKYDLNLKRKIILDRTDVYKHINTERDYQDWRWNTNLREGDVPDEEKPVAEWINYIEYHLGKAKTEIYRLNKEAALAEIRKVAALAVRAMEIHGCPKREIIESPLLSVVKMKNGE